MSKNTTQYDEGWNDWPRLTCRAVCRGIIITGIINTFPQSPFWIPVIASTLLNLAITYGWLGDFAEP